MAEIIDFATRDGMVGDGINANADELLEGAHGQLDTVLIIGTDKQGNLYIAQSQGLAETILSIEQAKIILLTGIPGSYTDE